MVTSAAAPSSFGALLRRWRQHRRQSQEALAFDAEVSTRHLSCLEGGKASPSREMVLVLASALELPLRERNVLLQSAGFAAVYRESSLDDAAMSGVSRALTTLLEKQEPYGAVVVDRVWNVTQMNQGATRLLLRFPPTTTDPRIAGNVVRTLFHPEGLKQWLVNVEEVQASVLLRLNAELVQAPDDNTLVELRKELAQWGAPSLSAPALSPSPVLPVHLRRGDEEVRLITLLTTLGTPLDVTAQELAIESYFPADDASDRYLRDLAARG